MALHSTNFFPQEKKPGPEKPDPCSPCYIYPPPNAAKHPISTPTPLVLSLGIVGAALLLLSYFAMRRYASRRRSSPPFVSYNNREDFADGLRGPEIDHPVWLIRTVGLPQSEVDSIHRFSYKRGDGLIEKSSCSVCLSDFDDGDSLRLLPKCSHAFHVACIDTWLRAHTNCPLCRAPILAGAIESSSSFIPGGGGSGSGSRGGIEIRVEGSGEMSDGVGISNRAMIDGEMEPMRRCVSLDFSSLLSHTEVKKPCWGMRSMSLSGPSIPV